MFYRTSQTKDHTVGHSKRKLFLRFFALPLVIASLLISAVPLFPQNASASGALEPRITKYLYKTALATCIASSPLRDDIWTGDPRSNIGEVNASNLKWFSDSGVWLGPQPLDVFIGAGAKIFGGSSATDQYGRVKCSDPKFIEEALNALGYSFTVGDPNTVFPILCEFGYRRAGGDGCLSGGGSWDKRSFGSEEQALSRVLDLPRFKQVAPLSDAENYWLGYTSFKYLCDATVTPPGSANITDGVMTLKEYNNDPDNPQMINAIARPGTNKKSFSITGGDLVGVDFYSIGITDKNGRSSNQPPNIVTAGGPIAGSVRYGTLIRGCNDFASAVNRFADAYLDWAKRNKTEASQPSPTQTDPDGTASANTCAIDGLGWIICPAVSVAAKATDALWGWISNAMKVQPLNVDTSSNTNTMYIAWKAMRDIANVAFVIAFIIIVYSQLTGMGVSNYGVKKLLPRLVVAAILVNTSFWVAAIAVDVSNIFGNNLYNILRHGIGVGQITIDTHIWEQLATYILSLGAVGAGAAGISAMAAAGAGGALAVGEIAIWGLVVILLAAGLALLVAFVILAVRQALIIVLIVLSPLAFVAMLLPNTEKYFTLWRKSLTTLLVFYPLFAVLFGGSYLAGIIIIGSANTIDPNNPALMTILVGLAAMVLPLWLTPLVMRFSTGVLGQVAGMVNNKSRGLIDRAKNVRNRKARLAGGELFGRPGSKNPFSRIYRGVQNGGKRDAQRQKVIDATNQGNYVDAANKGGAQLAQKVANAELRTATFEGELKAKVEATKEAQLGGLVLRGKAAEQSIKATHAAADAHFEEMKSTSKAIPTGNKAVADAIAGARASQQQLNVSQSRQRLAESMQQQEYADTLRNNAAVAKAAGGIDPNGPARVVAQAIDAQRRARDTNVAAFSTVHKSAGISAAKLNEMSKDIDLSSEEREAASRGIIEGGDINAIKPHLDYLASALSVAQGEEAEVIKNLQRAAGEKIGSSPGRPMGIGAAEIAQLKEGDFKVTAPITIAPNVALITPTDVQTYNTVMTKGVSAQGWASMDKDDIGDITKLVESGAIPAERASTLFASIKTALEDPRISTQIKERETEYLNTLKSQLATRVPASSTQGDSSGILEISRSAQDAHNAANDNK